MNITDIIIKDGKKVGIRMEHNGVQYDHYICHESELEHTDEINTCYLRGIRHRAVELYKSDGTEFSKDSVPVFILRMWCSD